jgi:glycosyltransferase involved in cell wall biosynthesis
MTMLEAAALGRPVLATLVGGVPEILEFTPGSSGTRAEDAGAFAAAIDGFDVERDERIAAAMAGASDVVQRFSAKAWAETTLAGYSE